MQQKYHSPNPPHGGLKRGVPDQGEYRPITLRQGKVSGNQRSLFVYFLYRTSCYFPNVISKKVA